MKKNLTMVGAMLLISGLAGFASATSIDTVQYWDKKYGVWYFGEPYGATYGQTFVLPGEDTFLNSVTFYIDDFSGPDEIDFAFYIYAWTGSRITGDALFTSGPMSTSDKDIYEEFVIDIGYLELKSNAEYVWLVSASGFYDGIQGLGQMGRVYYSYNNGNFVYANNEDNFSLLYDYDWSVMNDADLAMKMEFSARQIPDPTPDPTPEPSAIFLLGIGVIGLAAYRKKNCKFITP